MQIVGFPSVAFYAKGDNKEFRLLGPKTQSRLIEFIDKAMKGEEMIESASNEQLPIVRKLAELELERIQGTDGLLKARIVNQNQ